MLDLRMILSIVTVILILIMAQTVPIRLLDVLQFMTLNISTVHVCQAVHILIEMSGRMAHISAILPAPMDIGVPWARLVLDHANPNSLNLLMMFFIVLNNLVQTMAQIRPLDAPLSMILNIQMVHVYQAASFPTEMNGMMGHISAILLALTDTLISSKISVLTLVTLNISDSRKIFSIVLDIQIPQIPITIRIARTPLQDALQFMTLNILMALAYQIVLIQEEMSGMMEVISATLLALSDILMV